MPSRQVRERQQARAAAARDVLIKVNIKPFDTVFHILKSQLPVLTFFTGYLDALNHKNRTLDLDGFHPLFFNMVAQWLINANIWPLLDNAVNIMGNQLAIVGGDPTINFSTLFDLKSENDPFSMTTARKLIHAYFMGQWMQASHFMDCVLNLIVCHLRVDYAPLPAQVHDIYERTNTPALQGLKKLLVDAYVWAHHITNGQVTPISAYRPEFRAHVQLMLNDLMTRRYNGDAINPENPRNREFLDVRVDFTRLQSSLCNDNQGRFKCRYHVHSNAEPCWNLIVDDIPLAVTFAASSAGQLQR